MGRLTSFNFEEVSSMLDNVKYWMDVYTKLKEYEEIIDEPEKLKIVDEMYFEKCVEVNELKKRMEKPKVSVVFNDKCK